MQSDKKGLFYTHKHSPLVICNNDEYIGGVDQFLEWALQQFRYTDNTHDIIYKKLAYDAIKRVVNETPGRSYSFMNLNTGAAMSSQVVFELFDDVAPLTCANFKELCRGWQAKNSK